MRIITHWDVVSVPCGRRRNFRFFEMWFEFWIRIMVKSELD